MYILTNQKTKKYVRGWVFTGYHKRTRKLRMEYTDDEKMALYFSHKSDVMGAMKLLASYGHLVETHERSVVHGIS